MEASCTIKSIVHHHLYMKTGSGYDRTFPDVMMTFVFGWGKTNIQQVFRKEEMNAKSDEQLEAMLGCTGGLLEIVGHTRAVIRICKLPASGLYLGWKLVLT